MTDLTSALSYALRMEVTIHTIISGNAFTALHRFIQLLEKGFFSSHPDISKQMRSLQSRLDSRRLAGFITASDWLRLLDAKVGEFSLSLSLSLSLLHYSSVHKCKQIHTYIALPSPPPPPPPPPHPLPPFPSFDHTPS